MTDAGLKELAGLKSLQSLDLREHAGDGRGAEGTGRAEELAIAGPWSDEGDGRGAEGAGRAESLQSLNLYSTQVTDAGLKELAGLKSLQSLDLDNTQVTDAGLKELAGLKPRVASTRCRENRFRLETLPCSGRESDAARPQRIL